MDSKNRVCLMFTIAFGLIPIVSGCHGAGASEWKWQRCYEGGAVAFSEISILLVANDVLPLRIRSIDGDSVREATEYHLLPGKHVVVSEPHGLYQRLQQRDADDAATNWTSRLEEHTGEPDTITVTVEPGIVYRLTAHVEWGENAVPQAKVCQREWVDPASVPPLHYWSVPITIDTPASRIRMRPAVTVWKLRERGNWAPRVEAFGSFESLRDTLARQQESWRRCAQEKRAPSDMSDIPWPYVVLYTGANPPKHWVLSKDGGKGTLE